MRRCGIFSNGLTTSCHDTSFQSAKFVKLPFIDFKNEADCKLRPSLTISGCGLGICIPIQSVPGIGATIRSHFALSDSAISLWRFSMADTLMPACGLTLICTTDGHTSKPSISTGTLNSANLDSKSLTLSTKNHLSKSVLFASTSNTLEGLKVGLSEGKSYLTGSFFCSLVSSFPRTFFMIISLTTCLLGDDEDFFSAPKR